MKTEKTNSYFCRSSFYFAFCFFTFALFFSGCGPMDVVELATPEKEPSYLHIAAVYDRITLNRSTPAEVLASIKISDDETVSQSKRVVASAGEQKEGKQKWFNMVSFSENELSAKSKYTFFVDERPKVLFVEPWEGAAYEGALVLGQDVLGKPYNNENARRIAVLKAVLGSVRSDVKEVRTDNKIINICGTVINQAFETVLAKLNESPSLAERLSDPNEGLGFEHPSFGKGKIGLKIEDDIAVTKIMLGSFTGQFKQRRESSDDI